MDGQSRDKVFLTLLVTLGVFIVGRFLGLGPLSGLWSFGQWKFSPSWYPYLWLGKAAVVCAVLLWLAPRINSNRTSYIVAIIAGVVSLAFFWLLRFDSLVYGGGNLRVAQLAQAEVVIARWYEYGTVLIATLLFRIFRSLGDPLQYAAGKAWLSISMVRAALACAGSIWLATVLTDQPWRRLLCFLLTFFGGHALLYLGFVGVETAVPPLVILFSAAIGQFGKTRSGTWLLLAWAFLAFGAFMFFPLIFLLPAAVYVTVASGLSKSSRSRVPLVLGVVTLAILIAAVLWRAGQSLEFAKYVLLIKGKLPFRDYGLLSPRHLGDWLQMIFLGGPLLIVALVASWNLAVDRQKHILLTTAWLSVAGGLAVLLVLDPIYGPPLDYPRFAGYLTPVSVLLAVLCASGKSVQPVSDRRTWAVSAAFAVLLPFVGLPVYNNIESAEKYTSGYLEAHEPYYLTACAAFRDSYFYHRDWDNANRWEKLLPVQSSDYMNLRGTDFLAQNKEYEEALKVQYQIIAKFPYWAEPRAMAATNQMTLGRYDLAKPQIDTCLLLEPYKKEYWLSLYAYYRDVQNYPEAERAVNRAVALAPSDPEVLTDKMIISYRAQNIPVASSLADDLLKRDSTLAYPWLIKAFIADKNENPRGAVGYYEKFLKLAPSEPEAPRVKTRVDVLKSALGGR